MGTNKNVNIENWEYSNQDWVKVLNEIWKSAPMRFGKGATGYGENHPIAKKLKIKNFSMVITFLIDQNLVEYEDFSENYLHITTKGFDVALQNQSTERSKRHDKGILFLSLVVAIAAYIQVMVSIDSTLEKWLMSILFVLAIVLGGLFINKSF